MDAKKKAVKRKGSDSVEKPVHKKARKTPVDKRPKKKVAERTEDVEKSLGGGDAPPLSKPLLLNATKRDGGDSTENSGAELMLLEEVVRPKFTPARRPVGAMKTVKLLPRLMAKAGKITGISFGRGRTPSPLLDNKMGDHTGSWTSVVDGVHARLFGMDVDAAIAELRTMQNEAQKWMNDDASVGSKLWDLLSPEDQDARTAPLELYAFTVDEKLTRAAALAAARGAGPAALARAEAELPELLADAVSHHLAFLNFLPFATVPAKGSGGSKGSGEGRARAKVLGIELDVEADLRWAEFKKRFPEKAKKAEDDEQAALAEALTERNKGLDARQIARLDKEEAAERTADAQQQLADAHEGLWGLFSMEAAVRAADVYAVVAPKAAAEHLAALKVVQEISKAVADVAPEFIMDPAGPPKDGASRANRRSKKVNTGTTAYLKIMDNEREWKRTLDAIKAQKEDYPFPDILLQITTLQNALTTVTAPPEKIQKNTSDAFEKHQKNLVGMDVILDGVVRTLEAPPGKARENGARVLARLLHDHQATVARAYPNAVTRTDFLGDKPDAVAAERMYDFIVRGDKQIKGRERPEVRKLSDKVIELYKEMGDPPKVAADARWVGDSRTASLVATFRGDKLVIQGRTGAPAGVAGMGSHTTAWVTEVMWMRKKFERVGKSNLSEALKQEATKGLTGELMTELAQLLPADQLAAGQLGVIFDAAVDVMSAKEPEDAVAAFLSFRNLLPYATVDAGSRGGHAERENASKAKLFDTKSLNEATTQKTDELDTTKIRYTIQTEEGPKEILRSRLDETVATMRAAALQLEQDLNATEEYVAPLPGEDLPPQTWKTHPVIRAAVTTTIKNMRDEATRLETVPDPKAGVAKLIYDKRWKEHGDVYAFAKG